MTPPTFKDRETAARAELLRRDGQISKAKADYATAIKFSQNALEQKYLNQKLAELGCEGTIIGKAIYENRISLKELEGFILNQKGYKKETGG